MKLIITPIDDIDYETALRLVYRLSMEEYEWELNDTWRMVDEDKDYRVKITRKTETCITFKVWLHGVLHG